MINEMYDNPLVSRYASNEMSKLFSMQKRIHTWRKLWIMLAEAQHDLGLPITKAQIQDLKTYAEDINWKVAETHEKKIKHDVMAHVLAYGEQAKKAAPIIHLGATSCYVTDNADLIIYREALKMIAEKTAAVILHLGEFARKYATLPTLGFTHMQPAQPVTVGKRATLWAQDFILDLSDVESRTKNLPARGIKGTTGTQASFLSLFDNNHIKVNRLDALIVKKMGFNRSIPVSGQTYSRKLDTQLLNVLAGIGESAHKFATDVRLLAHRKEIEEPFAKNQIGSSAMAYKRNPMQTERICSLARFVFSMPINGYMTHATQWMERTLDDSANRRLTIPQAFLAVDAILELCRNVTKGLIVYPKVIKRNLEAELPFMATENILMAAVRAGGNRQELHERIRIHSQAAARKVKEEGKENDLIDRLINDIEFINVKDKIKSLLDGKNFIGRASEQVKDFCREEIAPVKRRYRISRMSDISVRV